MWRYANKNVLFIHAVIHCVIPFISSSSSSMSLGLHSCILNRGQCLCWRRWHSGCICWDGGGNIIFSHPLSLSLFASANANYLITALQTAGVGGSFPISHALPIPCITFPTPFPIPFQTPIPSSGYCSVCKHLSARIYPLCVTGEASARGEEGSLVIGYKTMIGANRQQ